MSNSALLVIDIQNDYFPNGRFPLWNTDATLDNIKQLMARAKAQDIPIFLVQHVSSALKGKRLSLRKAVLVWRFIPTSSQYVLTPRSFKNSTLTVFIKRTSNKH